MTDKELEDAFQDIYNDVFADLCGSSEIDLYQHCITVCQRLFALAEYDFFKEPQNIPDDLLQEIATEYLEYQNNHHLVVSPIDLYREKNTVSYRANECISPITNKWKTTVYNLAKQLWEEKEGTLHLKNLEKAKSEKDKNQVKKLREDREYRITEIKDKLEHLTKYLPVLFGVTYNPEQTSAYRYETLRLLRILYDCRKEHGLDIGYLCMESPFRFQHNLHNPYKESIIQIRERIITPPVPYQIDYNLVIHLEVYVNAVKSYLHSLSDKLITPIIEGLPNTSWKAEAVAREMCYRLILSRLKYISHDDANIITTDPKFDLDAFRAYAYVHFLTLGTVDSQINLEDIKSSDNSELQKLEISEMAYDIAQQYTGQSVNLTEADIYTFCMVNRKVFSQLFGKDSPCSANTFLQTMKRNKKDYFLLARFNNHIEGRHPPTVIEGKRLFLLICLYENAKRNSVNIPISWGYSKGNKMKPIKIKNALDRLYDWADNNFPETADIEIFLISHWLAHRIYAVITYRTYRIQVIEQKMKKLLLQAWTKEISPIYYDHSSEKAPLFELEDFTHRLITTDEMDRIGWWIKKHHSIGNCLKNLVRNRKKLET